MFIEILAFVLIFLLSLLLVFSGLFFVGPLFARVPFVPVRSRALVDMMENFDLKDGDVFYDLGCGDGRVLFETAKKFPGAEFVGIEKAPFPYLLARMRGLFSRSKNVRIKYGDIFKEDLSGATHVFVYLFPSFLKKLWPKLARELRPGTLLFSAAFVFEQKAPDRVVSLPAKSWQINKKLNIYEF